MEKKFIKLSDVIKITGLSKQTIYQYTSEKRIPHYKFGRLLRFDESAIIEWLQQKCIIHNEITE